mmetsp:Transcript_67281/g.184523  ORF Transcript_67281/g.184523 Transcript_67281/m.184523 type:complete len:87 (-) Transcript_67281:201-461(-)|eukprot:6549646-Prymnesium_polylepis.4
MSDAADLNAAIRALFAEGDANRQLRLSDPDAYHEKMLAAMPTKNCSLCREAFKGWGHNPAPVLNEGIACDACNAVIVVPQRIRARK